MIIGGVCLVGAGVGAGAAVLASRATQPTLKIRSLAWTDLVPEAERAAQEALPSRNLMDEFDLLAKEFNGDGTDSPWQPMPQSRPAAEPRAELDGETVALSGYMAPLDFTARETQAFLLVPYVGACIHVPAPPANQIVLVESEEPVPVLDMWQPFTAIGTLRIERLDTGLAQSTYVMALDRMVALDTSGGPEEDSTLEMQ